MTRAILVSLVLGIGFLCGAVWVGRAGAQTAAPTRYMYQCFTKWPGDTYKATDKLNEQGKQGWHLLPSRPTERGDDVYCFERAY